MEAYTLIAHFIGLLNNHDTDHLAELMTPDHCLTDSWEKKVVGRDQVIRSWKAYFQLFPDYFIEIDQIMGDENLWIVMGHARNLGSDPLRNWRLPACWKVLVKDDRIRHWQVYCDTQIPQQKLNLSAT